MGRRLLAGIAVALVALCFSQWARAAITIESYRVTVRPGVGQAPAHFTLTLGYRAQGELKTSGFKYVGTAVPTALQAHAPDGAPLRASVSHEARSGEERIDFAIPVPDDQGIQTVILEFDQPLRPRYAWSGKVAEIPWAHEFRLPVGATTLRVVGPNAFAGEGLSCTGQGEERACERAASAPFEMRVPTGPGSAGWVTVWTVVYIAASLALFGVIVRRRRALLATRGVLLPATAEAYPEVAQSYRAPPSLPLPGEAQAVLSDDDRTTLVRKSLTSIFVIAIAQFVLARFLLLPFEVGFVLIVGVVAMTIPLAVWISKDQGARWFFAAIGPTALFIVIVGFRLHPALSVVAIFLFFAAWIGGLVAKVTPGVAGSTSSSSSSGSSSSCGGGGGGCGGGGGGGGCGG